MGKYQLFGVHMAGQSFQIGHQTVSNRGISFGSIHTTSVYRIFYSLTIKITFRLIPFKGAKHKHIQWANPWRIFSTISTFDHRIMDFRQQETDLETDLR